MADEASTPLGGDEGAKQAELRASHEDRDLAVDVLRVAAGDGRLTAEELDARLEAALTARTYGELAAVMSDLPTTPGPVGGPVDEKPKDVVRIDCHSSTARRDGRWTVPRRMEVRLRSGSVTLDFTEAVISSPSLHIDADIRGGSLKLIIKPGILVSTDDLVIRSSHVTVPAPTDPAVPVMLRIGVSGQASSGNITARLPRLPRRTFWQWLRRRRRRPPIANR